MPLHEFGGVIASFAQQEIDEFDVFAATNDSIAPIKRLFVFHQSPQSVYALALQLEGCRLVPQDCHPAPPESGVHRRISTTLPSSRASGGDPKRGFSSLGLFQIQTDAPLVPEQVERDSRELLMRARAHATIAATINRLDGNDLGAHVPEGLCCKWPHRVEQPCKPHPAVS